MIDPVCGMTVEPASAAGSHTHARADLLLLQPALPGSVRRRSGAVLSPPAPAARDAAGHRAGRPSGRVRCIPRSCATAPGACPICGMALEPRVATADEEPQPGARRHDAPVLDQRRRRRSPLLVLAMGSMVPALRARPAGRRRASLGGAGARDAGRAVGRLAVLRALPRLAREPQPEHVHADRARRRGRVRSTAWSPCSRPGSSRPRSAATTAASAVYFEPAAVIVTLVLLGQVLELRARGRTGAAIRALLKLAPKRARRVRADGGEEDVPLDDVQPGRSAARPSGRERPGRRRRRGRRDRRRRIDGHRRADARRETRRRSRHRRARSTARGTFVMRAERVGAETLLARIVADGRRGAAQPRADPEAGRRGVARVRARGRRRRGRDVRRLGRRRPAAAPRLRAGQRRRGADHRLPVRARAWRRRCRSWSRRARAPARACCSRTPRRSRCWARSTRWSSTRRAR